MSYHRLSIVVLAALVLAGCSQPPTSGQTPTSTISTPTVAPTQPATPTSAPAPTATPTQPPAPTATTQPAFGGELLFLRKGALIAFDIGTRKEHQVADGVRDFTPGPDGRTIALVRGAGRATELWLVRRDGGGLVQLTGNDRAEERPAWSPDGLALLFGSSTSEAPYQPEWLAWSAWCAGSEIHLLSVADHVETSLGAGCDPAFSPDGKRIAFATPPSGTQAGVRGPNMQNAIRLINRQGQNGWSFATASASASDDPIASSLLVYAPAWSPDGAQIAYHRFVGYRALVDINLTEIGGSFEGKGQPLNDGAGWLLPTRFAPGGQLVAITQNNNSDPRGWGGWDNWSVAVLRLDGTHQITLPSGTLGAVGQQVATLARGQSAAWSPDGMTLAVVLPPGWSPQLSPNEPLDAGEQPGEIWRWHPGDQPAERLAAGVDFASPLAWLPAAGG